MTTDVAQTLRDGPWEHRFVAANGARFHVAEAGTGPLVLLLHGFPQFWWAWRDVLPVLASAGFRAVALDLRGYAASDKPPRGYDTATTSADVAGVVRALGERRAVVVGHDWGAWVAWSLPGYAPRLTRAVAALALPHPLDLRAAARAAHPPGLVRQFHAQRPPELHERRLRGPRGVADLLAAGGGPGPDEDAVAVYRAAMAVPFAAHTSVEYHRWAVRSLPRQDGRRFVSAVSGALTTPVLTLAGADDALVPGTLVTGSHRRVRGRVTHHVVEGAGHYLLDEEPAAVAGRLVAWLRALPD